MTNHRLRSKASSLVAALLIPLLMGPVEVFGQSPAAAHPPLKAKVGQLSPDEKLLLVLNRFTYGPRPGDLEKLRSMGLQTWFNRQLAPQTIDDGDLDRRLARFPAMQLPLPQLMALYPNRQAVRKEMNGRMDRPGGQIANAIYKDSIERYKEKLKNKDGDGDQGQMAEDPPPPLPQDVATLIAMTPESRFSVLCKFTPQQLTELRRSTQPADRIRLVDGFTPPQFEALAAFESPVGLVGAEDTQTKLLRDIYSERQLDEVMVDFWLNHFNVYMKKSQDAPYYIDSYERDTIRPHALGSFESLLVATAGSPAMLNYLDNAQSIGPKSMFAERAGGRHGQPKKQTGLNENYARELMELHTLGVNGGYTQKDVTEVAKVFTGWTVGSPEKGGVPTRVEFDETRHEPGSKTVLGVKIKENGEKEGLEVLHMLATSPQTARFISTKIAVRFVADDPPKALIDQMTKTFQSTHGDIRKVLLSMVNSPEFFTTATYRAKVKTPQDFVVSTVRASGAEVESAGAIANVISDLGMPVYGMQTPNGYSMKADPWNSSASLIARLNFALALSSNRVVGVRVDWNQFLNTAELDPAEKESELETKLLHLSVSERTREAILAQVTSDPAQQQASLKQVAVVDRKRDPLAFGTPGMRGAAPLPADTQAALAAGLLFGSPEFQRR
ncbi:uncharacterized protein (DUF1800 family) [Granulicella aggregans]|uniref:Uncharacterized protein (DUF1800 family) n=1 Tax=Granulicella aggregans TaxID=474949 RepID=A0A7W7ZDX6_9BACT|nr:DUF1800 domain-containing protein [Granulicella aggregans]MBB5058002.1 uncharacterized protein (DUF1800 family) [Granulicella aggregans]